MKTFLLAMLFSVSVFAEDKTPVLPKALVDHHEAACPDFASERGQYFLKAFYALPESPYSKGKNTLYVLGCEMYTYNSMERAYIVDPEGHITDVYVADIDAHGNLTATEDLMGAEYDPASQTLGTFQKGRGMGDCGAASLYLYTGEEQKFILKEARIKDHCDGDVESDWPVVYSK